MGSLLPNESEDVLNAKYFKGGWPSVWVSACGSSIQNLVRGMSQVFNSYKTNLFKMSQRTDGNIFF